MKKEDAERRAIDLGVFGDRLKVVEIKTIAAQFLEIPLRWKIDMEGKRYDRHQNRNGRHSNDMPAMH